MEKQLNQVTLKSLIVDGTIKNISMLRFNTNGYPFVTVLNSKGQPNNLYFSKKTSEIIKNQYTEGDNLVVQGFLKDANVVQTENSTTGETRFKISVAGANQKYASINELEAAFGITEETNVDFNKVLFVNSFATNSVMTETPAEQTA
jgi:hypothetical protein